MKNEDTTDLVLLSLNIDRHTLFLIGWVHTAALTPPPVWGGHSTCLKADEGGSIRTCIGPHVGGMHMGKCVAIWDKEWSLLPFQPLHPYKRQCNTVLLIIFYTGKERKSKRHPAQLTDFNIVWNNCVFFLQPPCLEALLKTIK